MSNNFQCKIVSIGTLLRITINLTDIDEVREMTQKPIRPAYLADIEYHSLIILLSYPCRPQILVFYGT